MKIYRVYTENKNYENILQYLNANFDGYTIFNTLGIWHGIREKSLCIEIADATIESVEKFAYFLKKHNKQESVLIQIIDADIKFI